LSSDALEVLRTLVFIQKQIPAKDGRWFSVSIMPYRTFDDRIDGLVITFFNISDLKEVEVKLNQTEQMNRFLLNSSSDIIVKLSTQLIILEYNQRAEKFFGKKSKDTLNQSFIHMFIPEPLQNKIEKTIKKHIKEGVDGKLKMKVTIEGGAMADVTWFMNMTKNKMNMTEELLLYLKS
jgi:two-component system CheB/CheR fusion protein